MATRWRSQYFLNTVYFQKLQNTEIIFKFAIVTSKKQVHKRSNKRNRVRRRIRSALLQCLKTSQFPSGIEIEVLFMANKKVIDASWEELQRAVSQAVSKLMVNSSAFSQKGENKVVSPKK